MCTVGFWLLFSKLGLIFGLQLRRNLKMYLRYSEFLIVIFLKNLI